MFTAYIIFIIAVALIFDFCNGLNDAANSIATIVGTRVLTPRIAVLWAAFFNFIAAFFFGTEVASTIGKGLIAPGFADAHLIFAALVAAIVWTWVCTQKGLPISVSHALIGSLIGAALVKGGFSALTWSTVARVAIFIVIAPIMGFVFGWVLMVMQLWICRNRRPHNVDTVYRVLQLASAAVYSLSHGLNDAQKTMGIIVALLMSVPAMAHTAHQSGNPNEVAWWIILSCHAAIALGTYLGGWKVVKTLGHRVTKLEPIGGFAAETSGGLTIIAASVFGIPVSTTHTITGAIFGVGVTKRLSSVRWSVGIDILTAWILTLPMSAAFAAATYYVLRLIVSFVS
ncbi:MAG: inorganic phosphate transporter [Phycisphaerae bacterium]|nr:inorganic phosphate transporter [Phycisphaerae bacterium]